MWIADEARLRPANERPPGCNGSPQSPSVPGASRRRIAKATAWLGTCLIEGLAAYGEAMSPGFFEAGALIDPQEHERNSQPGSQPQDEPWSDAPWLNATRPQSPEQSGRSVRVRTGSMGWSAVARFWSRMRRERGIRRTITQLTALDDRTREDVAAHQSQAESVVRYADRYE
jgi:hypothetical protein